MINLNDKNKIIEELFRSKVYLGHKKNRTHPAFKKYIYSFQNGNAIIDLNFTYQQLMTVKKLLKKIVNEGNKKLLMVSTKKIFASLIENLAQNNNFSYLNNKWPSGFLTNFDVIYKNIEKIKQMKKDQEEGKWKIYPKHEQLKQHKELRKLENIYQGVINLDKKPDFIFIIDFKKEFNAFNEAKKMGVKTMGICDTNFNPNQIDYPIFGNDDLLSSVSIILNLLFS